MEKIALDGAAATAVIGWIQLIKPFIPSHPKIVIPIAAFIFGEVYAFGIRPPGSSLVETFVSGLMVGVAASGIYSQAKNAGEKEKK